MNLVLAIVALAANFITPDMTLRRGLTDEQYEYFWSLGRNPQIDQTTARSWMFQSARYTNVTNWLDIVGKTNDFARLAYTLQSENFALEATNAVLSTSNFVLRVELAQETVKYEAVSNQLVITNGQLDAANAKIQDEIYWLNTTYPNVRLMARDCTDSTVKRYLLNSLVPAMTNRITILNALTLPTSQEGGE